MGFMDFASMMKNLPAMMGRMKEMQEKLKSLRVRGSSGGGMVEVELDGSGEVLSVRLDRVAVNPDDVEMLQDLIVAALADARAKVAQAAQEQLSEATGGVDLSALGLKFPGLS